MSSLSDLRSRVRYRLGQLTDLTSGDGLTALDSWINDAYSELVHTVKFHEFESEQTLVTVASTRTIALASNIYAVLSVVNVTSNAGLDPFAGTFAEYDRTVGTSTGKPREWLHFAGSLYLKPIPDAVYSMRLGIWQEPVPLTLPADTPTIPVIWHKGIEILATRNGWRARRDNTRANDIERGEWKDFLMSVRTPIGIESHNAKRRGVRVRMLPRDRRTGV